MSSSPLIFNAWREEVDLEEKRGRILHLEHFIFISLIVSYCFNDNNFYMKIVKGDQPSK